VFGKQNLTRAWRIERVAIPVCLRSLHEYAYTQRPDASPSPSHGGPPV